MRLYKPESISWHMQFVRSLYPSWDDQHATTLLDRFGLVREQAIKGLSHGQRVKTMLLLILARQPKLLILDEPTNGLDPVAKQEVLSELMNVMQDEERTILIHRTTPRTLSRLVIRLRLSTVDELSRQGIEIVS